MGCWSMRRHRTGGCRRKSCLRLVEYSGNVRQPTGYYAELRISEIQIVVLFDPDSRSSWHSCCSTSHMDQVVSEGWPVWTTRLEKWTYIRITSCTHAFVTTYWGSSSPSLDISASGYGVGMMITSMKIMNLTLVSTETIVGNDWNLCAKGMEFNWKVLIKDTQFQPVRGFRKPAGMRTPSAIFRLCS